MDGGVMDGDRCTHRWYLTAAGVLILVGCAVLSAWELAAIARRLRG